MPFSLQCVISGLLFNNVGLLLEHFINLIFMCLCAQALFHEGLNCMLITFVLDMWPTDRFNNEYPMYIRPIDYAKCS